MVVEVLTLPRFFHTSAAVLLTHMIMCASRDMRGQKRDICYRKDQISRSLMAISPVVLLNYMRRTWVVVWKTAFQKNLWPEGSLQIPPMPVPLAPVAWFQVDRKGGSSWRRVGLSAKSVGSFLQV